MPLISASFIPTVLKFFVQNLDWLPRISLCHSQGSHSAYFRLLVLYNSYIFFMPHLGSRQMVFKSGSRHICKDTKMLYLFPQMFSALVYEFVKWKGFEMDSFQGDINFVESPILLKIWFSKCTMVSFDTCS